MIRGGVTLALLRGLVVGIVGVLMLHSDTVIYRKANTSSKHHTYASTHMMYDILCNAII